MPTRLTTHIRVTKFDMLQYTKSFGPFLSDQTKLVLGEGTAIWPDYCIRSIHDPIRFQLLRSNQNQVPLLFGRIPRHFPSEPIHCVHTLHVDVIMVLSGVVAVAGGSTVRMVRSEMGFIYWSKRKSHGFKTLQKTGHPGFTFSGGLAREESPEYAYLGKFTPLMYAKSMWFYLHILSVRRQYDYCFIRVNSNDGAG